MKIQLLKIAAFTVAITCSMTPWNGVSAASRATIYSCSKQVAHISKAGHRRHSMLKACEANGGKIPGSK